MKVFKYTLRQDEAEQTITLSKFATILSVQNQNENLVLYATSDNNIPEKRTIGVVATGQDINALYGNPTYIGAVLFKGGTFVLHVFEL